MRELREWLHWATNERQVPALERADASHKVSDSAGDLLGEAAAQLHDWSIGDKCAYGTEVVAWCLEHHPEAFRDLCLAFADAIEKMREQVPEAERRTLPLHQTGQRVHLPPLRAVAWA